MSIKLECRMNLDFQTPKEIVAYLDEYIIGQNKAKRAIAIALRNRYRKMQLTKEDQEEIVPKNILMIGSTGVGKTEIARRMAKILGLPFIKVEASKYTQVGYIGRDVESMVKDLVIASFNLIKEEFREKNVHRINDFILEKIAKKLIPSLPSNANQEKQDEHQISFNKMKERIQNGSMDDIEVEIDIVDKNNDFTNTGFIGVNIIEVMPRQRTIKKKLTIKEAKELLKNDAIDNIISNEDLGQEALKRAEENGIIFIDEIDKIALGKSMISRDDPAKEGVQRDLLPIVEGSNVDTKYGNIKTDHILFIAAGAFHVSKPSDLIPELQGRFPIRVELDNLDEESLYKILTQSKNSILKQHQLLFSSEKLELTFEDEAIRSIAYFAFLANEKTEDIGARRLHTILEHILEDISFNAPEYEKEHKSNKIIITKEIIENKLQDIIQDTDATRYIL